MTKTVLKETIIILLICVVILLVLGVIFYDYNPFSKVIPNKISYSTDKKIKEQIQDDQATNILTDGYNQVYSIDNADLDKYKKSDRYVAGKENPFSELDPTPAQYTVSPQTTTTGNTQTGGTTTAVTSGTTTTPTTTTQTPTTPSITPATNPGTTTETKPKAK